MIGSILTRSAAYSATQRQRLRGAGPFTTSQRFSRHAYCTQVDTNRCRLHQSGVVSTEPRAAQTPQNDPSGFGSSASDDSYASNNSTDPDSIRVKDLPR